MSTLFPVIWNENNTQIKDWTGMFYYLEFVYLIFLVLHADLINLTCTKHMNMKSVILEPATKSTLSIFEYKIIIFHFYQFVWDSIIFLFGFY